MLYHISPARLVQGDILTPGERGWVCLCTSIAQCEYWAAALWGQANGRREESKGEFEVFVYAVSVLGDGMVEDCCGHYAFEYSGWAVHATLVVRHDDDNTDGEVVSRNPVTVWRRIMTININPLFEKVMARKGRLSCIASAERVKL